MARLRLLTTFAMISGLTSSHTLFAQSILYVDDTATGADNGTSWCDAYRFLQDALAAARTSGDTVTEIRVAQGTYKPDRGANQTPGDRAASFELVNGVALRGGYAGCGAADPNARDIDLYETILSGDLDGDDEPNVSSCCFATYNPGCDTASCASAVCGAMPNCCTSWGEACTFFASNLCPTLCGGTDNNSYHVATAQASCASCVLSGIIVTAGNADNAQGGYAGGAIITQYGASVSVDSCTFKFNRAQKGAAAYLVGGTYKFADCSFFQNYGVQGPGIAFGWGNISLIHSKFHNNFARSGSGLGGAVFGIGGPCELIAVDSTFVQNKAGLGGGAIYMPDGDDTTTVLTVLIGCIAAGNKSSYGGAMLLNGNMNKLLNTTMVGNKADMKSAGKFTENLQITNSLFAENFADSPSGATSILGDAIIASSIWWGNIAQGGSGEDAQFQLEMGSADFTRVILQGWTGGYGGVGNTGNDPLFVDVVLGSWAADAQYDANNDETVLSDETASWLPDEWVGKFLNPDMSQYLQSVIVSNTGTTLTVLGDFASLGITGAGYKINDYHLSAGSPCIDAGDNSAVPADVLDLDDDGNTLEPVPFDLDGNPRFKDDPTKPDTGVGTPPIVDMGAYEYQPPCESNTDCDNGRFCDGTEVCTSGVCGPGSTPCAGRMCDEVTNACVDCLDEADCDDADPCNGTESCDATGSCLRMLSADCNSNAIEDACDIRDGQSLDRNGNDIPDECEPWACCAPGGLCSITLLVDCDSPIWVEGLACNPNLCPIPPIVAALGSRYLSVTPRTWQPDETVAIHITSPQFPCLSKYVALDSGIGRVIDNPVFLPASEWGTVRVADAEIVPATTYEVQTENTLGLSYPTSATTPLWCDVSAPIGIINVLDIVGVVDRLKALPGAPPLEACDLFPAIPDQDVNALDVVMAVDTLKGSPYPFSLPCP